MPQHTMLIKLPLGSIYVNLVANAGRVMRLRHVELARPRGGRAVRSVAEEVMDVRNFYHVSVNR